MLQGHVDNVGDSVLRRYYADALREIGPLTVWAGPIDAGYRSGLGLRNGDVCSGSPTSWVGSLLLSIVRGGPVVALNAGQYTVTPRYLRDALVMIPLLFLARLRGGRVIWMGAAVPEARAGIVLYRLLARLATDLSWRDARTGALVGRGAAMPDWAFAATGTRPHGGERGSLGLVVRGDRPKPSAEWVEAVRSMATRLGLGVVAVAQVKQDDERAAWLGEQLHGAVVRWSHDEHAQQERVVRSAFAECAVVIGDRLHGLIMAQTEGAPALAWSENATAKIPRHFEHLLFDARRIAPEDVLAEMRSLTHEGVVKLTADQSAATSRAWAGLEQVRNALALPGRS